MSDQQKRNSFGLTESDLIEMREMARLNRLASLEDERRQERGWVRGYDHVIYCRPMIDEDIDWGK